MFKYWRIVRDISWEETVSSLHLNSGVGLMVWILGTALALAGLSLWGTSDAAHDEMITRIISAIAIVGAIPFVFAWKFVGTIPKMHKDLRDWTYDLEEVIINSQNSDEAIVELSKRLNAGMQLYRSESDHWLDEMRAWEKDFDKFISENFKPGLFHQMCVVDRIDYTVVTQDGVTRTYEMPRDPDDRAYFAQKLNKVSDILPHADVYFKGKNRSLAMQHTLIQMSGLVEHRSNPAVE